MKLRFERMLRIPRRKEVQEVQRWLTQHSKASSSRQRRQLADFELENCRTLEFNFASLLEFRSVELISFESHGFLRSYIDALFAGAGRTFANVNRRWRSLQIGLEVMFKVVSMRSTRPRRKEFAF